jgi:hypothetical protein
MPNVFDSSSSVIGAVQSAMLTEAQFQAQFGTGWVLARGQSVSGSKYASITGNATVPDLRGVFLRGKNNGRSTSEGNPDGESALGLPQADQYRSHNHAGAYPNLNASGGTGFTGTGLSSNSGGTNSVSLIANGGNETRPRNVTVNYFIRIN